MSVAPAISGPWNHKQIWDYLDNCRYPVRLAVNGEDGYPRLLSVWYRVRDGALCCATHRSARLVSWLRRDPRCGFEIATNEAPYFGVRGRADVELQPLGDDPLLQELLARYLGNTDSALARWLLSRQQQEMLITLRPIAIHSWDYRKRMEG